MNFFTSSIGRKLIMAITGVGLLFFVIAHLLGNLQIFLGQEAFNDYAELLRSMPGLLWTARIGLLVIFVLHIVTAISLYRTNRSARPSRYLKSNKVQATLPSLYMLQSGLVVLLFVLLHLAHFTLGYVQPEAFNLTDPLGRHDVYSVVIHGFLNIGFSLFYIGCMFVLGLHLHHGIQSTVQTLGLNHSRYMPLIKKTGATLAAAIFLGYAAIPLAVLTGIIGLP